jgi:hypothetical protein
MSAGGVCRKKWSSFIPPLTLKMLAESPQQLCFVITQNAQPKSACALALVATAHAAGLLPKAWIEATSRDQLNQANFCH